MDTTPCSVTPDGKGGFNLCITPGTWEFHLVTRDVWRKAGMPRRGGGSLCVGCIETRLGRRLRRTDFKLGDNGYNDPKMSTPRLLSRIYDADDVAVRMRAALAAARDPVRRA